MDMTAFRSFVPRLIDRQACKQWKAEGGTSLRERAKAAVDGILAGEPRIALPGDVAKQVTAIADRAVAGQGA